MKPILTPKEMAAADRAVIEAGTPVALLMQRAGAAVARATLSLLGGAYGRRIVIVAGKGNNGGDGVEAAVRLALAGAHPVVFAAGEGRPAPAGIRVMPFDPGRMGRQIARADGVIDALFGTGFRGVAEGAEAAAVESMNSSDAPRVSIDIPSGVDGETGRVPGPAVRASLTVTMGAFKPGLLLLPGCDYAGDVEVADIGFPPEALKSTLALVERADVGAVLPKRSLATHKRSAGTVLIVAGSAAMPGAAALSVLGALRAGAGLVTLAAPASVAGRILPVVPEATTLPLPETADGTVEGAALEEVLRQSEAAGAVAVGPGLSRHPETASFVRKLAAALEGPLILDADALNHFEGDLAALSVRTAPTLLTPHPGEAARLLGSSSAEIQAGRIGSVRLAAERSSALVLLKGYRTLVAEPGGRCVMVGPGGPALATGGSGDVLTGVLAALIAGGAGVFEAAWAGAWLHGRAGDLMAAARGERGIRATDVANAIPEAILSLWSRA